MSTKKVAIQPQPIYLSLICFALATTVIAAVITQFTSSMMRGFDPVSFFSFFTIESNVLAAAVLLLGMSPFYQQQRWFGYLRGAATLCIVTTGIIYATLLSGLEQALQTTIPWVNLVLHYFAPIGMFLWWLISPPRYKFTFQQNLFWLLLPLAYVVYSLIRGPFVDWYPYPFLDPRISGYGNVILMSVLIFGVLVGIVGILTGIARLVKKPI